MNDSLSSVYNKRSWLPVPFLQAFSSCLNDCTLDIQSREAELLHYDFSSLANVTGFNTVTLFTSRGVKYSKRFNVALCGKEVTQLWDPVKFLCGDPELITFLLQDRTPATCVNNVTGSTKKVKGYICQSTIVPSGSRSENVVSSQPFVIGDSLIGMDYCLQIEEFIFLFSNSTFRMMLTLTWCCGFS